MLRSSKVGAEKIQLIGVPMEFQSPIGRFQAEEPSGCWHKIIKFTSHMFVDVFVKVPELVFDFPSSFHHAELLEEGNQQGREGGSWSP